MIRPDLRLYIIVDPEQSSGRSNLPELAAAAVRGGATLVQYRDKHAETGIFVATARAIKAALRPFSVPLLINDRCDVAQTSGAAGVHIGQSDMTPQDARRLLGPGSIIGLTVQSERDARLCPDHIVDYACIGGVFATASKDNPAPPIGLSGLASRVAIFEARGSSLPLGAIAGITERNAASVIDAGVGGIAVIAAVARASDPERASRALRTAVDDALAQRLAEIARPYPPLAVNS